MLKAAWNEYCYRGLDNVDRIIQPGLLIMATVAKALGGWNNTHDVDAYVVKLTEYLEETSKKYPECFKKEKLPIYSASQKDKESPLFALAVVPIGMFADSIEEAEIIVAATAEAMGIDYWEEKAALCMCDILITAKSEKDIFKIAKQIKWRYFCNEWNYLTSPRFRHGYMEERFTHPTTFNFVLKAAYIALTEKDVNKLFQKMEMEWGKNPIIAGLIGAITGRLYNYKNKEAQILLELLPQDLKSVIIGFEDLLGRKKEFHAETYIKMKRCWRGSCIDGADKNLLHPVLYYRNQPNIDGYKITLITRDYSDLIYNISDDYIFVSKEDYLWLGFLLNKEVINFDSNGKNNCLKSDAFNRCANNKDKICNALRKKEKSELLVELFCYVNHLPMIINGLNGNQWTQLFDNRAQIIKFYEGFFWLFGRENYLYSDGLMNICRQQKN